MAKSQRRPPVRIPRRAAAPAVRYKINAELRGMLVPVGELREDPENARRHPEDNLAAIRASYERFGQQKPIVAAADGTVVAGSGQLRAAVELGWTHVAVVRADLDDVERRAFAIADNRIPELATWDGAALSRALESLPREIVLLTGFHAADAKRVIDVATRAAAVAADGIAPPPQFQVVDENLPIDHKCPKCGYEWSGKPKR